jgi:hypothetical protein
MKLRDILASLMAFTLLTGLLSGEVAFGQREPGIDTGDFAKMKIERLRQTAKTLEDLAGQPLPAQLSASEQREARSYALWLKNSSQKLNDLADRWQSGVNKDAQPGFPKTEPRNMQEMNQSFNMQYLGLQQQMQDESRRFTLVSNIMKTKHDTAKNSISNLR